MDDEKTDDLFPNITTSTAWPTNDLPDLSTTTLNSVFRGEPIANNCDLDNYLQSLDDHEDPLLNVDDVSTISAILKPEQGKNSEQLTRSGSKNQGFDLGPDSLPSLFGAAHGQTFSDALPSSRPSDGVRVAVRAKEEVLPSVVLKDLAIMQDKRDSLEDTAQKDAIKEGLIKIKEHLDKSEVKSAPDLGPAVVTEFIDNSGISFHEDVEETSKCSVDSMENVAAKETEAAIRRSGRKTTRLFDIVGPRSRKSGGGDDGDTAKEKALPRKLRRLACELVVMVVDGCSIIMRIQPGLGLG